MKRNIYFIEYITAWSDDVPNIRNISGIGKKDIILIANVDDNEEFNKIISEKCKSITKHIIKNFFETDPIWMFYAYVTGNGFWREFIDYSKNLYDPEHDNPENNVEICPDIVDKIISKLDLYEDKSLLLGIGHYPNDNDDDERMLYYEIRKLDLWDMVLIETVVDPMKKSDILDLGKLETIFKMV